MERNFGGVFLGSTLIQTSGVIGGAKSVFVKLQGNKNDLVYPTFGGMLQNPFKGPAKIFAGDLFEYRTDENGENPKLYLLKTFKVAKATSAGTDTSIFIERDGYKHIPFVGDVLMKAPATFETTGAAYTLTAVEATTDSGKDVWKITFNTALGELAAGDILVEAAEENASGSMLVQNPNTVADKDFDMFYTPATDSNKKGARYNLTPALHGTMYIHKMSPMPAVVLGVNKSRVNGWFEI